MAKAERFSLTIEAKTVVGKTGVPLSVGAHLKLCNQVIADLQKAGKIPVAIKNRIKPSDKFGAILSRQLGGLRLRVIERDVSAWVGVCGTDFCIKAIWEWYDRENTVIHIYRDASRSYFEPAMKRQLTSYESIKFTILHEVGHYKGVPGDEVGADKYARDHFI